ncbi:hypothetical protein K7X08_035774 [Anisodus acutangulus]|uniref:Uncharacterized protein n=1 Tax=Anisodus acutangulus TaxID=402998 RepID=A0A9Q1QVM7_9SOLA|nr:hypothetical protein K7X08_035774 [Anisodus acutangulus]
MESHCHHHLIVALWRLKKVSQTPNFDPDTTTKEMHRIGLIRILRFLVGLEVQHHIISSQPMETWTHLSYRRTESGDGLRP